MGSGAGRRESGSGAGSTASMGIDFRLLRRCPLRLRDGSASWSASVVSGIGGWTFLTGGGSGFSGWYTVTLPADASGKRMSAAGRRTSGADCGGMVRRSGADCAGTFQRSAMDCADAAHGSGMEFVETAHDVGIIGAETDGAEIDGDSCADGGDCSFGLLSL